MTVAASSTDAAVTIMPDSGALISDATIADGSRNTIGVSAVGASAAFAYNTATFQDLAIDDTVSGNLEARASNRDGPVTVIGTIDGASIEQGHDNVIAVSGVGASAQLGVTDDILGSVTVNHALALNGDITLAAENSGPVTVQTDIGTNGEGARIDGGTRNAFSVSAVGASAGVSVLAVIDDGTYASQIAIGNGSEINISAINSGDVTIGSTDDPTQAATLTGATLSAESTDGSISVIAIGASGFLSSTTIVYSGSAEPSVTFGEVTFDVENSGSVNANVSITDVTLEGRNSISVGAVGTSVSNSQRFINYADDSPSVGGTFGAVSFAASNGGSITVAGGIGNAAISSGFAVAIAASALGASAAFTLP